MLRGVHQQRAERNAMSANARGDIHGAAEKERNVRRSGAAQAKR